MNPLSNGMVVLSLVDDLCQTRRIARRLDIKPEHARVHMQWCKRHGYVTYEGSRWNVTEVGRAVLAAIQAERAKP